jgi:hypothetical protein
MKQDEDLRILGPGSGYEWDLGMQVNWVTPMSIRRLLRLIKIKKLFGYGLE